MSANPTYDEIVRDAQARIKDLNDMIVKNNDEMDQIAAATPSGPLPADAKARLAELRDDQKSLSAQVLRISLVTAEKLDKTSELQDLVANLRAVRTDLEKRRARIERFAQSAERFGATLQGISQLATRIDGLRKDIKHLDDKTVKDSNAPKTT
jgi:DNA repair exonuclease SbcCD ATPase subunit